MNKRGYTSYLIKAIMLLLALIIMVVVATVAWFVPEDYPATAEGLSVKTKSSSSFEIAIGFSNSSTDGYVVSQFERDFNLEKLEAYKVNDNDGSLSTESQIYNVFNDFTALDVTGNGITLVRPELAGKNSYIDADSPSYGEVIENQNYISFDMYIKSSDPCSLYLDDGSKAIAVGENDKTPITMENAMVGALRVAFFDYPVYEVGKSVIADDSDPNALWIPRPDIRYDDTVKDNPKFITGIENEKDENAPYKFLTGYVSEGEGENKVTNPVYDETFNTYKHHYFHYEYDEQNKTIDKDKCGYKTYGDSTHTTIAGDLSQHDQICLVDTWIADKDSDGNDTDEGYYYGKMHVNIWIEGCDSEARRALRGSKFNLTFNLQCEYDVDADAPTQSDGDTNTAE